MPVQKLKLGIPKGSLQDATIALFERAGWRIFANGRSYFPPSTTSRSSACSSARRRWPATSNTARSTPASPAATGSSKTSPMSNRSPASPTPSKAARPSKWVLAVPEDSPFQKPEDLAGKIIATELVEFTKRYFASKNIPVKVEFSWGATEVKPPTLADAIVEVTETGSSLRANRLRIIETLMESETQLIANKSAYADAWKREQDRQHLTDAERRHRRAGPRRPDDERPQKHDLDAVLERTSCAQLTHDLTTTRPGMGSR